MPAQLSTRAQVNGYRFLLRRLDHAMVRRDIRMLHDPMRSQLRSLIVGAVLALLLVAGCSILAFIHPQGTIGDKAKIVMGKDSGALYIVDRDQNDATKMTLHPVLNLASARLITGSNETPKSVKDAKLNTVPRGPLLGIPGAPAALLGSGQGDHSNWTLCDSVRTAGAAAPAGGVKTTAIVGKLALGSRVQAADPDAALLVRSGDKTYLIYDGKRAQVDTQSSVVARTLNLGAQPARPISLGLLGVAAEVPMLTPPVVPHADEPGPGRLNNMRVGTVIRVAGTADAGKSDLYVVLDDGVQSISAFTAQLLRNADSHGMSDIPQLPPDVLDGMRIARGDLPVDEFPAAMPKIVRIEDAPVACMAWSKDPGTAPGRKDAAEGPADRAGVTLLTGTRLPLPDSAIPMDLASGNGGGSRADSVYVPPATGELVQVTGTEAGSARRDGLFYVSDNGIRYGLPDIATAEVLGLGRTPRLAPWAIVSELVPGPILDKQSALVSRDVLLYDKH
ncbi:type VII secretion protein EccB [Nocardia sp. alder85J]|uniref:type VII secretion protein EccB n=1 Tax=Nocardia sp. alder85J TaxID=2862949 RepID=UPI001CD3A560|nr:type VII secretion protein EccB [Nocardia sp. alder85J]MCX4093027.1 type VII secretion protein EccB [Nocardia sp. alder85J]